MVSEPLTVMVEARAAGVAPATTNASASRNQLPDDFMYEPQARGNGLRTKGARVTIPKQQEKKRSRWQIRFPHFVLVGKGGRPNLY